MNLHFLALSLVCAGFGQALNETGANEGQGEEMQIHGSKRYGKSLKLQASEKLQTSNSKHQRNPKLQIPNPKKIPSSKFQKAEHGSLESGLPRLSTGPFLGPRRRGAFRFRLEARRSHPSGWWRH